MSLHNYRTLSSLLYQTLQDISHSRYLASFPTR